MSEPIFWVLPPFFVFLICYFYTRSKTKNFNKRYESMLGMVSTKDDTIFSQKNVIDTANAKIEELNKTISELQKKRADSRELIDFMQDLKINGYGVVRIDPDAVFYRGTR